MLLQRKDWVSALRSGSVKFQLGAGQPRNVPDAIAIVSRLVNG